jgi:hypothetical protein
VVVVLVVLLLLLLPCSSRVRKCNHAREFDIGGRRRAAVNSRMRHASNMGSSTASAWPLIELLEAVVLGGPWLASQTGVA